MTCLSEVFKNTHRSHCFFFFFSLRFTHLFERQCKQREEAERSPIYWFMPPIACSCCMYTRPKPGARSSILVSHVAAGTHCLGHDGWPPRMHSQEVDWKCQVAGAWMNALRCDVSMLKWWLNLLCYNACTRQHFFNFLLIALHTFTQHIRPWDQNACLLGIWHLEVMKYISRQEHI